MTSLPPKRSASVTTPSGIDIHALIRGGASCSAGIALDPDQFGRAAADIEQDRAAPFRIEQRRAADHGQRRLGLAIDHLEPDAGLAATRSRNLSALAAARQASVAISRRRLALR